MCPGSMVRDYSQIRWSGLWGVTTAKDVSGRVSWCGVGDSAVERGDTGIQQGAVSSVRALA